MTETPVLAQVPETSVGHNPTTEAEALCGALLDMGVSLSFDFDQERLLLGVDSDMEPKPGALALFHLVADRAALDEGFREDVISAVSHLGTYLSAAPGINADLKSAAASDVLEALGKAGLLARLYRLDGTNGSATVPVFMALPGGTIAPNAHLLMKLAADRYFMGTEFSDAFDDIVIQSARKS